MGARVRPRGPSAAADRCAAAGASDRVSGAVLAGRVAVLRPHAHGRDLAGRCVYARYNGAMIVYLAEDHAARVRTTGFSLAYSLAAAFFGGFTPAICTYLIHLTGNRAMPGCLAWCRRTAQSRFGPAPERDGRCAPNLAANDCSGFIAQDGRYRLNHRVFSRTATAREPSQERP